MTEAVIVAGVRTPIGRFGGALAGVPAADLAAAALREALARALLPPELVEEVILGCAGQYGEEAHVGRLAAQRAGLPQEVPAYNVNRLCGSGLQAINSAATLIEAGETDIVVAGGVESMSRVPYVLPQARWGARLGDATLHDGLQQLLSCPFHHYHMGVTAENVARRYNISREEQDTFALRSQQRAIAAMDEQRFAHQIVPVIVPQERGEPKTITLDEHPRRDTSLERLATLPAVFQEGGTVTAGNSSGINDGAAIVVVMAAHKAVALGLQPRLIVRARAAVGVDPAYMGLGPVPAVRRVLAKAGLSLEDIDLVEINEAFAAPTIACGRELGLDGERTNVNGGAIALGHPVGATGAILTVKLLYELERWGGRYGLVTLCIGGGQGIATLFERPSD